jgi:hypothetical protein
MAFLYPLFLAGALAIALPIVLHFLRRDIAPDVPFTAVRLLRASPVERTHKRRLRDLILLAARVLALLLLAAAFARPYLRGAAPSSLRVVAIDRSYSMGGGERFARALEMARGAIDAASSAERIAVVAFDDTADVVAEPGGAADARSALDGLSSGYGATRYDAVFDRVRELAGGVPGHLAIVTDLQQSGWEPAPNAELPPGWQLELLDAGAARSNVAVTALVTEADRVVASIRNEGPSARSGRIRVALARTEGAGPAAGGNRDANDVAGADYTVRPGEELDVPILWKAPAAGAVTVSIDDPDGLPADDSRYAVLDSRGRPKVLLVATEGRGGLYLARALESSAGEEGALDVEVVSTARLASMTAADASAYPLVALLSTRGIDRRGREVLAAHIQGGAGLLVAASPDVELPVLAAIGEWRPALSAAEHAGPPLTLAATDPRHPILRPFGAFAANLGQVRFDRRWRVDEKGWLAIARFEDGTPALLERTMGQGRVVLFASDLDRRWNDFPLHPAFVPFALETARYLAGDRQRAHAYTVADAPVGTGPGPGIFRTTDNRIVAVNVDTREGRPGPMTPEAFGGLIQRAGGSSARAVDVVARQAEARQSYWQYGLLVMIAALVAESFVGRS